ncbi:hypothetical protein C2S53_000561 [Perilla frutescens var. hirtella]|uniref:Pentatricopeptide repeat-containing protein n=1 Tax=Perilla frutescens var. hirtella TaxID=608512 RepID=A0AAD4JRM3_PERFH|nr:hypothetical protein C2S53_000561 [Perilla frutescens var. hirtella]
MGENDQKVENLRSGRDREEVALLGHILDEENRGSEASAMWEKGRTFGLRFPLLWGTIGRRSHFRVVPGRSLKCDLIQNKKYDVVYLMFINCRKRFETLPNVFTCNILLKALCKEDGVEGAVKVLDEMPETEMVPNMVSYTTIMAGYVDRGDMLGAKRMFNEPLNRGWFPDATTFTILIDRFSKLDKFVDATKVTDKMVANGVEPNDVTYGVMIESLCKVKKSRKAINMISDMLDNNYVPSSTLCCRKIDVLWTCDRGELCEAGRLWDDIVEMGCPPNSFTYNLLSKILDKVISIKYAIKDDEDRGPRRDYGRHGSGASRRSPSPAYRYSRLSPDSARTRRPDYDRYSGPSYSRARSCDRSRSRT